MTPELLNEANRLEEALDYIDKVIGYLDEDTLSIVVFRKEDTSLNILEAAYFEELVGPLDTDILEVFKESLLRRKAQFQHEFGKLPEERDFNKDDFNKDDLNVTP